MGSPFPSHLTVSAHGQTVAWVFNLRGARNVWVAKGPDFHAHAVTHYKTDNGQDISDLVLTPNGKTVVYVHGNERNDQGQVADPSSSVQPPHQNVYAASVHGGEPRLLGTMDCGYEDCEDVRISPNGRFAVWAGRGKIWIAPVSGAEPARPLTYDRGHDIGPRWSPSGKMIAFDSQRGDHSFIAIYDFGQGHLRYIAPNFDRDVLPRWSPGGKRLAFIRMPGARLQPLMIPHHYSTWQIMVANPQTGQAHAIWHSGTKPQDSFNLYAEMTSFSFAAGNRIVFASQRDGWKHLYVVSANGGKARLLTPGNFAINTQLGLHNVFLMPDRRSIVYASNQGDIDRSHLWRVSLSGGAPVQLTSGKTIECSPVVTTEGHHIVFLSSSGRRPLMPYLFESGGMRKELGKKLFPKDFPTAQLIEPREVVFHSLDGTALHGHLFVPPGKGRHPAILYLHGGPMRQMLLGFNPQRYYHYFYAADEYLASRGYVVFSVNYRMGTMYGWAFRHPAHAGWRGASEYQDVVASGRYLAKLPYVDPHRIGIWGGSYGGYLTGMALARNSDLFAAGVDLEGMSNRAFTALPNRPAPDRAAAEKLAFENSPDNYISTWRSPVLLIQGDDDRNVAFSQNVDLADRLRAHHVPFQTLVFPNEVHMFLRWHSWIRAFKASAAFFNAHLQAGKTGTER